MPNSAQAQPEKGMRLCAKRYGQVKKQDGLRKPKG